MGTKAVEEPKKTVKRRDKNATTTQEEPKKKGIARSGKSGQSGHEQGLENEKVHKKKGGTGANASTKQSTEEKSAFRKIKASKMHSKSTGEEIKPKKKGGSHPSKSAFNTSSEEAAPKKKVNRTGKMNQTSESLGLAEKTTSSKKKKPLRESTIQGKPIFSQEEKVQPPPSQKMLAIWNLLLLLANLELKDDRSVNWRCFFLCCRL